MSNGDMMSQLFQLPPESVIAGLFIAVGGAFTLAAVVPQLSPVLLYGKLLPSQANVASPKAAQSPIEKVVSFLVSLTVPKSFFTHYYVFFFLNLVVFKWTIVGVPDKISSTNDDFHGLYQLLYVLNVIQGLRRLLESIFIFNYNPNAKMNVAHWILGIGYYFLVSSNAILAVAATSPLSPAPLTVTLQSSMNFASAMAVLVFVLASIDQTYNHIHLSKLAKYTNPSRGLFRYIDCAHYFDEVVIYTSFVLLVGVNKPISSWNVYDVNILTDLLFVILNLSVTANGSHSFYEKKFDDYKQRWRIIPGIF